MSAENRPKARRSNKERRSSEAKSRPHPPSQDKPGFAARAAATELLTRVIDDQRSLDGLLDTRHGPKAWKSLNDTDKALTRAIVMTALRHRGEISGALQNAMDRNPPKRARHLIHTLHVSAAQILFLDVPDSAAVDLAIAALKGDSRSARFASLGNAVLRKIARQKVGTDHRLDLSEQARINTPGWVWQRLKKGFGKDKAQASVERHMQSAAIDITVREDVAGWAEKLGGLRVFGNTVRTRRPGRVDTWPGYEEGAWWVQDAAASLPVHLLGDISGKRVLDLCAAPGGKTAQLIASGAEVTAVEASVPRIKRLKDNLSRLKLQADVLEADLFEFQPDALFDAVLLDAPCSSTGTIRRHPDIPWTKSKQEVEKLAELQYRMIIKASEFVRKEGILVFSNCSIDRMEGEDLVARLGRELPELKLDPITPEDVFHQKQFISGQGTVRTLPCHLNSLDGLEAMPEEQQSAFLGLDGFFAARFIRSSG